MAASLARRPAPGFAPAAWHSTPTMQAGADPLTASKPAIVEAFGSRDHLPARRADYDFRAISRVLGQAIRCEGRKTGGVLDVLECEEGRHRVGGCDAGADTVRALAHTRPAISFPPLPNIHPTNAHACSCPPELSPLPGAQSDARTGTESGVAAGSTRGAANATARLEAGEGHPLHASAGNATSADPREKQQQGAAAVFFEQGSVSVGSENVGGFRKAPGAFGRGRAGGAALQRAAPPWKGSALPFL